MTKITNKITSSNELRPHTTPSLNLKEDQESKTTKLIKAIEKYLKNNIASDIPISDFELMKSIYEILNLFLTKYSSKIIYVTYKLGFASRHFQKKQAGLNNGDWIDRKYKDFEKFNIIKRLRKSDKSYKVIMNFWKNEFRNTKQNSDVELYIITENFKPVMEEFYSIIAKRHFTVSEINRIQRIRKRYENYNNIMAKRFEKTRNSKGKIIGNCIECNKEIFEINKRGKDYHVFNKGIVCNECKIEKLEFKGKEWTRNNR